MRRLIVLSFITLDGVMQAPGAPEEDPSGGFKYGGWTVGYFDDFGGSVMVEQMGHPFDLLLGRRTYDIFAGYWPKAAADDPIAQGINKATKYVVSHRPVNLDWKTSVLIDGDVVAKIKKLKAEGGPELQVHGSGNLIQTLLKHDLLTSSGSRRSQSRLGRGSACSLMAQCPSASNSLTARSRRAG